MILKADKILRYVAMLSMGAALMMSCDNKLVFETEGDCEDVVLVSLKYDYNIQRADMRKDHVGWTRVMALDESGTLVAEKTVANNASSSPIRDNDFCVEFRGLQPGRYHFMAMAMQRPYDELASRPKARFRAEFPKTGEKIEKLKVMLDRQATATAEGYFPVDAPKEGLDTLWLGFDPSRSVTVLPVEQQVGRVLRDTVSLMRETKYLHLTLHNVEENLKAEIWDSQYRVRIVDNNGTLGYDSTVLADDVLEYTPFAQWTTALSKNGVAYYSEEEAKDAPAEDPIIERAAHFNLSFSRLMYYTSLAEGKNAALQIFDAGTGKVVAEIDLPMYLSFGRDAFAVHRYSSQEYLDREYNYNLDFFLQHGEWKYLDVKVNITAWSRRFQNVTL